MRPSPSQRNAMPVRALSFALLHFALMAPLAACAFKIIPPHTVTVQRAPDGEPHTLHYPVQVIVHDEESFWDLHQIKNNVIGLADLEAVRVVDILADLLVPGPERRPVENGIEWIKNRYAELPPYGPVKIIGELFWAIGPEKAAANRGTFFFPRVIYVTEWLQVLFGELNSMSGFLFINRETLIPRKWTAVPNRGVDWAQSRLIGLYVYLFQGIDWCLDKAIDGVEAAEQKCIWLAVAPFFRNKENQPNEP